MDSVVSNIWICQQNPDTWMRRCSPPPRMEMMDYYLYHSRCPVWFYTFIFNVIGLENWCYRSTSKVRQLGYGAAAVGMARILH